MIQYQSTPDYYRDYIEHGLVQRAHKYIDKYMKNGKWIYRYKSKAQELGAKVKRTINGIDPETPTKYGLTLGDDNGRRSSSGGRVNTTYQNPKDRQARLTAGIKAGRKRTTAQRFSAVKGAKNKKGKNLSQRGYSRANQYGRKDGVSALSDVQGATAMYLNGNGGKVRKRSFDEGYRKMDVSAANYLNEQAKETKANKNSAYNQLMEETTRNGRAAIRARKNRKAK